ncbi:MAG TPA: helix-turn-helix transcriptional regulator [Tissierellales bacterium]|nr:helix-turn-helix transcriptional regulator [Tissierellales bacterium]
MSKIGNMIKSLRIREDMTQGELAQKLNLSRSSISMYENNERKPPTELLEEIADLFNVDMNYITGRTDKEYYLDLKTRQIAQEILNNSELRALFDASRGATPEDLEITKNLLISLKNKERGGSID